MPRFEPVIGLEVHVQLQTRSKLFCGCSTSYEGQPPNSHVCPVCLGLPGALPVLNEQALRFAVRAILAVGGQVASFSKFDRKNYFYPDLPKAYQISQYDKPIGVGGFVTVQDGEQRRHIQLTRIHMEEDAGKLVHEPDGRTLVDYNRAAVPLLEIVSEPTIRSAQEARLYLLELKSILEYIEVSDCNMEEGSLRCDANVSVRPEGSGQMGTKVEIKNLNSIKWIARAIEYEIDRQSRAIEGGGRIVQETRLFDPERGVTESMRSKEQAHDYRYFPEPDLPPICVDPAWIDAIRQASPELPAARRTRLVHDYGLPEYDAAVLTASRALAQYYEDAVAALRALASAGAPGAATPGAPAADTGPKILSNWVMTEVLARLNAQGLQPAACKVTPAHLASLVRMIETGTISGKIAKDVFEGSFQSGEAPAAIVAARGLMQLSDRGALEAIVQEVLAANADAVASFRAGKSKALGALVGAVMQRTKGKASPAIVNQILKEKLQA